MITFCITLLPNAKQQAIPAENGTTTKHIPVKVSVTDVAVELIITILSTDSKIGCRAL